MFAELGNAATTVSSTSALRPWDPAAGVRVRWGFFLAPIAGVLAMGVLHVLSFDAYSLAVREDGVAEWFSFASYLAAGLLGLVVAATLRARGLRAPALLFLLLSMGLVFVAGEEISWGQRQLGFAGPSPIVDRNMQDEANLHNLLGHAALHTAYICVGLYAATARLFVDRVPGLRQHPRLYAPPPAMALFFLLVVAYYVGWFVSLAELQVAGVALDVNRIDRFQEFPEMILSMGFFFFMVHVWDLSRADLIDGADAA